MYELTDKYVNTLENIFHVIVLKIKRNIIAKWFVVGKREAASRLKNKQFSRIELLANQLILLRQREETSCNNISRS